MLFRSHQSAAANGLGIVLLPSFTAAGDQRLLPVLHGQVEVKRDLWLATHDDSRKRPKIVALMDFIRGEIEADSVFLQGN